MPCCSGEAWEFGKRAGLTDREMQIADEIARGRRAGRIAQDLVLSRNTVYVHERRVRNKLGGVDRCAAVVRLRDVGFGDG